MEYFDMIITVLERRVLVLSVMGEKPIRGAFSHLGRLCMPTTIPLRCLTFQVSNLR
jgi:hypothetical protein